jgi:hypothetical protein
MNIWLAIAAHFIGDYPCQSIWMCTEKGKSWEVNFYHAAVYASVFLVLGCAWWQFLVLLATHFMIDPLKARWGMVKTIWQDQLLHAVVVAVLFWW